MIKAARLLLLVLFPITASAQTITLGSIAKTSYCIGDTLFVPYTASGTFASDNFFFAQLSDASGSFVSFSNWGHGTSPSGLLAVHVLALGSHYRVRVASFDPFVSSEINLSDIEVIQRPNPLPSPNQPMEHVDWGVAGFVQNQILFRNNSKDTAGATYLWHFDQDAAPSTSLQAAPTVTYPTDGLKTGMLTITNRADCSQTSTFKNRILTCHPIIPPKAHMVNGNDSGAYPIVWVKTGAGYVSSGDYEEIYVEPGGSVTPLFGRGIYYIRNGGSFVPDRVSSYATVVLSNGTSLSFESGRGIDTFYCSNLTFDYSQLADVEQASPVPMPLSISIRGNHIIVSDANHECMIRIFNIVGIEMLSQSSTADLDFSSLPPGVYFAEAITPFKTEVRKIVK